ncbi:MAG: Asp-tRNA(Asn)/Glu-tRNA(Gln) amidotransferase subunit GatC [bacterium]
MLNKKEVEKISELAKIPLKNEELSLFSTQLPKIISFVEKLNELKLKDVKPTYQVIGKKNEFKKDTFLPSLPIKEVLQNVKTSKDGYFLTKGVLDAK